MREPISEKEIKKLEKLEKLLRWSRAAIVGLILGMAISKCVGV